MQLVTILLLDYGLSQQKTQSALCSRFGLTAFDFGTEFKKQLAINDELTKELNSYINQGEVIPIFLLDEFIRKHIINLPVRVLLTDYPKTIEQFQSFEKLLLEANSTLESIWFIKQHDPEKFLRDYFSAPREKQLLEKFGKGVIQKWQQAFAIRRNQINAIMEVTKRYKQYNVEMDFESAISEAYILSRLNANY